MKIRITASLIVLAVLVSIFTGCTAKNRYLIQAMKLAPEDASGINYVDLAAMVEDPEFDSEYDNFISYLDFGIGGIEASDVYAVADFVVDDDSIIVFIGDFNLEDIRDALNKEDFIEGEYEGVELWTYYDYKAIAFIDNMIVSGYTDAVKACIRIHNNERASMYDNKDVKSIVDRLPSSVSSVVFGTDSSYDIGFLAGGICLLNQQRNDEVWDITGWYKFDSEASAEAAMEDVEDMIRHQFNTTQISSRLSGQFIEITAEVAISEY